MPETDVLQAEAINEPSAGSVRETRIDPAHEFARVTGGGKLPAGMAGEIDQHDHLHEASFAGSDDHKNVAPFPAEDSRDFDETSDADDASFPLGETGEEISPELIEQFHHQARQLSAHLNARQRELDRRESELNATLAQHEASGRSARLWFQERHYDLEDRRQELDRREQKITERLLELDRRTELDDSQTEANFDRQQQLTASLTARENDLAVRDLEVVRRQAELDEHTARLFERQQELDDQESKLRSREAELKSAQAALALAQVEFEDGHRQVEAERERAKAKFELQRQQYLDQRKRDDVEHQQQAQTLSARWGHLQRRAAALDQSRAEALRLQRETLEMRLATEELWAQMSGIAPPATITQTLASLRAKLAEQQRLELADIATQRRHVEELAARIAKQHELLAAQRQSFETWSQEQKRALETQAADLSEREQDLHLQQDLLGQQRRHEMAHAALA